MRTLKAIIAASLISASGGIASAQQYPAKPIRMIVSIAAGSVTDVIMRAAANELQPRLGQPLTIENRGGAAGIIGGQACAQAEPDGYNICVVYHSTMSYNPLMFSKLPYDPDKDFAPITRLFMLTEGVFVSNESGISNVADFMRLSQAKPDAFNFATLGDGSFPDLFLRWVNNQWGTRTVGVPYKGGGPAAQALAANQVQVTRFGVGNFLGLLDGGKVKAIALSSNQRSATLPNVPTFAEVGWGGYPGQGWWGLVAPKGTPPAAIERLNKEFVALLREPAFVAFLEKQFTVAAPTAPAEFLEFLQADRKAAKELVAIANVRAMQYEAGNLP